MSRLCLLTVCGLAAACCAGEIAFQQVSLGFAGSTGSQPQGKLLSASDGTLYGTTYSGGVHGFGTVFRIREDGSGFAVLHNFTGIGNGGANPYCDLIFGEDGALYGTTVFGGTNEGGGTLFKIRTDGSGFQVVWPFNPSGGAAPRGNLEIGLDGAFYGTMQTGGGGTIYRINQDGTGFAVLHFLGTRPADGINPDTGLRLASDGMLYGVASSGGSYNLGTLFRLRPDGSGYTNLHHFRGPTAGEGYEPDGRLLELADGKLYGTTGGPGFAPPGSVYRLNRDGSAFEVLKLFNTSNGEPSAVTSDLIQGSDGALYATSTDTLFKIQPDGSGLQILKRFSTAVPSSDGFLGRGVVRGASGALFGATSSRGIGFPGSGTLYRINEDGSDFSTLFRFQHPTNDLRMPRSRLIHGRDGLFYGTTESGGRSNAGTIFSIRTNMTDPQVLHVFGMTTNAGRVPNAMCEGSDGRLYGTAQAGGNANIGLIFRIERNSSNYTVLRHLGAAGGPRIPRGGLIEGADSWLYGMSFSGGAGSRGTVFKIHKDTGELIVIRDFFGGAQDGGQPHGELVRSATGAFYGTTSSGGPNNFGTIFRINSDGSGYATLHSFTGGVNGQNPQGGLMIASDGKLYGAGSRVFGSYAGTVFRISQDGSGFETLKTFLNSGTEPKSPRSPVTEGPDGVLYGTTLSGGTYNHGTLFRLNKDGTGFEVLRHFGLSPGDGQSPSATLTSVGDGSFLGVTEAGGDGGRGTIFRFDPEEVRLRIGAVGANAEFSWNRSSTSDMLEGTTRLLSADWQSVSATISEDDYGYEAVVPIDAPTKFFRVRRTWP